jgi:transposase-like protein
MLQRIRLALQRDNHHKLGGSAGGPVEVDETFIAPNLRKMHKARRLKLHSGECAQTKAIVMGMLDRELRQVRAKVIPYAKREILQEQIIGEIEKGSTVYTDKASPYDQLNTVQEYVHETVNHMQEYVRGEVHTQGIDNFWSLLKRGLRGTYVAVEPFHLDRYVTEQIFRYNNRATKDNPLTDSDRFLVALSQVSGKRLTYAELTGKVEQRPEVF